MSKSDSPIFVVHKHLASKLHYDLRLELGGALKSWTVPRGPSMDPRIKRFATEGKTLPLRAATFEGGNEAQKIIVWDTGSLEFSGGEEAFKKGLEKGRLTFVLRGKKLHGAFSMFRFVGKSRWLLMKRRDKYATSEDPTQNIKSVLSGRILRDPEPELGRRASK
jgi:bifunctional non-homologous end joining protein LigD